MSIAIQAEHVSKEYRLGVINHGMLYKDMQSWMARKLGRPDPHAMIGKEYFDSLDFFWALKDVSFKIAEGDRVGLIGRNGAGKSTMLKLLSRITAPTEGQIKIRGRITSLLEVGTGFHPELTGRENVYLNGAILGMSRRDISNKFDEIVSFAEVEKFIDTPVKRYSSGMYVRLAFSVAAHLNSEILLADEVLAVGDSAFQKKCIGKMDDVSRNQGRTVVFVSHNMASVSSLCNKGILLDHGKIIYDGEMNKAVTLYLSSVDTNEVHFNEGLLESAAIAQEGDELIVTAHYRNTVILDIPCLGVKLLDGYGNPIFSINPRNYETLRDPLLKTKQEIVVRIKQPKLHDGSYNVSLYLGDSKRDYAIQENCLKVDIKDMVILRRPANPLSYGPVHPDCVYTYS